ncbi:MAG: VWA domain-containing protein [Clostridiaceae bacterium]|nr:VWA domain-containing protein [Clostridiaceae bacterium]
MSFINPWGLISFISIPILIILYILKQQHSEHVVSSTYLWKKTELFMQASTPWQKLRRNLLFFLQLLMLLFLSLAISRPVILSEALDEDLIVIIDTSASMRAEDVSPNRFEYSKREILKLVNGLLPGQKMSLIEAGNTVNLLVSRSDNKQVLREALDKLECGYADANIDGAYSLADSIIKESNTSKVILYSDKDYEDSGDLSVVNVAKSRENVAITQATAAYVDDSYTVMSTVVNYGSEKSVTLELYVDDRLVDAKTVFCEREKPVHTYWRNISQEAGFVKVKITEKDVLPADNEAYAVLSKNERQKILLVSEESYFIEKVLQAIGNFDIYKTTKDKAESQRGFDLYIYDGFVPTSFQNDGNVWVINPTRSFLGLSIGDLIKGSALSTVETFSGKELSSYINAANIYLARFREVTSHENWEVAMKCGELPAIVTRTTDSSQQFIVLLFNISESNLPLLKEFPVLVQNMLTYTLPSLLDGDVKFVSGQHIEIKALPNAQKVEVTSPKNVKSTVAPPFPPRGYEATVPGLYHIRQEVRRGEDNIKVNEGYFTVSIPGSESALPAKGHSLDIGESTNQKVKGAIELWPYLLLLVIIIGMMEWWVYYRGNQL